jgi:hypothetical protein
MESSGRITRLGYLRGATRKFEGRRSLTPSRRNLHNKTLWGNQAIAAEHEFSNFVPVYFTGIPGALA